MKEHKRKLQIVAGSTYSLSLPKEWVQRLNLVPKQELILTEQQDGNLIVSPAELRRVEEKMTIPVENYSREIDQILLSLYFYGYTSIEFVSVKEMATEVRNKIRKTLVNLSGAEIIYEDKKTISIKVMFDSENSNLYQIFYRINLIIEDSVDNLVNHFNWEEIKLNEDEIDRLYYLSEKIINSSLTDRSVLVSSGIQNLKIIPSLFLISKKLEHIGDNLKKIARQVEKDSIKLKETLKILPLFHDEINRSILYLMGKQKKKFEKIPLSMKENISSKLSLIKDTSVQIFVERIYRDLRDIQDEVVTVGFFGKLFTE